MKKKTYVWLASLLLMLVATLTSCEKFALDDSGTNSHDANANVIIHVSVAKNNSTGTRSGEVDYGDEETGDEDGLDEGDEEVEGKPLEDYCSRLSIAIFDGEEKVKTLNLKAEDATKILESIWRLENTEWLPSAITEAATVRSAPLRK